MSAIIPGIIACGSRREVRVTTDCDPYWDNVVLAMHMDGSSVDSSPVGTTMARSGGSFVPAPSDFSQEYSTGNAADNSGTNRIYLSTPSITYDLNGSDDFTIEALVTVTANMVSGASASIVIQIAEWNQDVAHALLVRNDGSGVYVSFQYITGTGTNGIVSTTSNIRLTLNQRYHIAGTRHGNVYRLFVDGNIVASTTDPTRGTIGAKYIGIGATWNGQRGFPGKVDNLRITKGVARYTESFPRPTAPFGENCYAPIPDVPAFVITEKEVVTEEPPEFIPNPPAPALTGAGGRMLTILGDYAYCVNKNVQDEVVMFNKTTLEVIARGGHGYFGSTYGINDLCTNGTNKIYAAFNQGIRVFQPTSSALNEVASKTYFQSSAECLQLKYASGSLWLRRPTVIERLDPDTLEVEATVAFETIPGAAEYYGSMDTDGTDLYVYVQLDSSLHKIDASTNVRTKYDLLPPLSGVLHVISNGFAYFQTSKINLTTGVSSAHSLLLTYSKDTNNTFISKFNNIFTHYLAGDKGKGVIKIIDSTDDTVVSTITNFQELAFGSGYGTYWSQFYKIPTGMGLLSEDKLIISNGDIYGNHSSGYSVYELQ